MGISIADNFNYQGSKPLDARVMFGTIADMVAFPEAGLYDGIEAFVGATGKYYSYNSSNTVDETLGKWRKRSGGHEIEDAEGTAVTEREVIQFGDGFLVEDDTENVKTNVSFDNLASGEIEDVITPKPSVRASYQKYSTDEQIVGEWIDGKPLYQKTYALSQAFLISAIDGAVFDLDIPKATTNVLMYNTYVYRTNMYTTYQGNSNNFPEDIWSVFSNINKGGEGAYNRLWLKLGSGFRSDNVESGMLTIQYTKTTD